MKEILAQALNVLYPRHCPICHEILEDQRRKICPECEASLHPISGPRCRRCSRPVAEQEEYCPECEQSKHEFTEGLSVFVYNEEWKISIEKYKYYGCREYGEFFALCMTAAVRSRIPLWKPDLIVPVPLHRAKQRARGFNQSWDLARQIGEALSIPAEEHLVEKPKATRSQKKLTARERRQNLSDAFRVTRPLAGEVLLVVDDMYTTGSTMDAMAECLKRAGASRIYFVTLCMGLR